MNSHKRSIGFNSGLYGGKKGGEAALRCATKAVEIASEGFYDNDLIAIEVGCLLLA